MLVAGQKAIIALLFLLVADQQGFKAIHLRLNRK